MWDLDEVRLTRHFVVKREDRGVPWSAIAATLKRPSIIEPHGGQKRIVRGRLCIVVAVDREETPVLVTLLLRGQEGHWTDEDARSVFGRGTSDAHGA